MRRETRDFVESWVDDQRVFKEVDKRISSLASRRVKYERFILLVVVIMMMMTKVRRYQDFITITEVVIMMISSHNGDGNDDNDINYANDNEYQ